jgi:hypothetical protein
MTKQSIVLGTVFGVIVAAALGVLGMVVLKPVFSAPMFERTKWISDYFSVGTTEQFHVDQDGDLTTSGTVTFGSNGTAMSRVVTGSCTIWAPAQTIAGTTTQQVECQSATNGSLSAALAGITTDSSCILTNASSTNTTGGSIIVAGVSPTTTSNGTTIGSIVGRVANFTGGTFTWNAAASSTAKWKFTCIDPA